MKFYPSLLLLALLLPQASIAEHATPEDVAVLRAVIAQDCVSKKGEYVVLALRTYPVTETDVMSGKLDERAKESILERNVHSSPLPEALACGGVKVDEESKIDDLLKDRPTLLGLSKGFHEVFPDATSIMYLSLPGYSRDKKSALVHISYSCGPTCGTSFIVHLKKAAGLWYVVTTSNSWIG